MKFINQLFSRYKPSFKQDIMGGLLAAIISLPMGLAFGVQSGLGAEAGLYTAIILAVLASAFAGTKTLISDPTGPMTVVAATVVSMGMDDAGSIENAWPLIVGTFVLAGVFQFLLGVFDIGRYVKFMPYPVLSGFMAGIGVLIVTVQLFPILGHDSPKGFLPIISNLGDPMSNVNLFSLMLGGMAILIVYLFPLITKRIPSILVAIIVPTLIANFLAWDVPVIGTIPTSFPETHFDALFGLSWVDLEYIIVPAVMLAGLGMIDSLLTSVVADNITKTKHSSKRTVMGQGIGNIVTAIFGGIPGAGATMGTVTNIKAGAQTELSGILKGVFLLLMVISVASYIEFIPMSVLAGILITVGIGIIDLKGVKMLLRVPRQDAIVWVIVLVVTLLDNLLDAVALGFILSALLFIGKMTKNMTQTQNLTTLDQVVKDHSIPSVIADRIYVENLHGPLFFGFADQFRVECESLTNLYVVVIRFEQVPFLDQSGIVTLESVVRDWQQKNCKVYFVGANSEVKSSLEKAMIIPQIVSENSCFDQFEDCIKHIQNAMANHLAETDILNEMDELELKRKLKLVLNA